MDVTPIETVYNGYRFRSRLEARWAVFFDVSGIKYEYEPEGFSLGEHGYYLPDFWLPIQGEREYKNSGYFIEIKGVSPSIGYLRKIGALCEKTKHTVKVYVGPPWLFKAKALHHKTWKRQIDAPWQDSFVDDEEFDMPCWPNFLLSSLQLQVGAPRTSTDDAVAQSKQARFEHGQVGAPKNWEK